MNELYLDSGLCRWHWRGRLRLRRRRLTATALLFLLLWCPSWRERKVGLTPKITSTQSNTCLLCHYQYHPHYIQILSMGGGGEGEPQKVKTEDCVWCNQLHPRTCVHMQKHHCFISRCHSRTSDYLLSSLPKRLLHCYCVYVLCPTWSPCRHKADGRVVPAVFTL